MTDRFTRQEFYELIWSEPASKLGPRLGISGVGLAKLCRRAEIPVPERGYWARLQAGKTVQKRPLPPRGLVMSDTVTIGKNPYESYAAESARLLAEPIPPPPTFGDDMSQVAERVQHLIGKVRAPSTFGRAHPLVACLLDEDERRRERQQKSSYPLMSDAPLFDSPDERRRLRIINGLFLGLQRYGFQPWMRDGHAREVGVLVGQQSIGFSIDRVADRRRPSRQDSSATHKAPGRRKLRLTISAGDRSNGAGKGWEDTEGSKIEKQIREIVIELVVAGEARHRTGAYALHEWLVRRREELVEELRRRKEKEELLER